MTAQTCHQKIIILAGPNGAGKTTFARTFLPGEAGLTRFINADLIAAGLAPFAPETAALRAGRLMLEEMRRSAALGESFAFETTLSGLSYVRLIRDWQTRGFRVSLVFLSLPDPETAIARIALRVREGGHYIPDDIVHRRFSSGLRNLQRHYAPVVDDWTMYDNSGREPVLLQSGEKR